MNTITISLQSYAYTPKESFPFYSEINKILQSKAKNMPQRLNEFLKNNPSANQVFIWNQFPYACMYLCQKMSALSTKQKQSISEVVKIFLNYDFPLFIPIIKKTTHYHNFLDYVVGRGDLEFSKMIVPTVLNKMHLEKPQDWWQEVDKVIKHHLPKNTVAKKSGGIQFLQSYIEQFELLKYNDELQSHGVAYKSNPRSHKL